MEIHLMRGVVERITRIKLVIRIQLLSAGCCTDGWRKGSRGCNNANNVHIYSMIINYKYYYFVDFSDYSLHQPIVNRNPNI